MTRAPRGPAALAGGSPAPGDAPARAGRPPLASGSAPTPPAFVGPADAIDAVARALAEPKGAGIVLHGPRGIGKTALLQHLAIALPELGAHQPVYFDLDERARQPIGEILTDLAVVMSYTLGMAEPAPGADVGAWMREAWIPSVLRFLGPAPSLVLLVDEVDLAEPAPAKATFYAYLRGLLAKHAPHLRVVLALGRGADDLDTIAKRHFAALPVHRLGAPRPSQSQRPSAGSDAKVAALTEERERSLAAEKTARAAAEAKLAALTAERDRLQQRLAAAEGPEVVVGADPRAQLAKALAAEKEARVAAELKLGAATSERDALLARVSALEAEQERLEGMIQTLELERDQLAVELEAIGPRRTRTSIVGRIDRPSIEPAPRMSVDRVSATAAAPPVIDYALAAARRRTRYLLAAMAVALTGAGALGAAYALQPTAIELTPGAITLHDRGEEQRVSAARLLRIGARRPPGVLAWSSADPRVATVDAQGTITAAGSGKTRVEARSGGIVSSVDVTVSLPARIAVKPAEITFGLGGDDAAIEAAVLDAAGAPWGKPAEVRFRSNDSSVATVAGGKVHRAGVGTAVIEAHFGDLVARIPVTSLDRRAASTKGCDAGQLDACVELGRMAEEGEDGPRDRASALAWYEKACAGGSTKGCIELGAFHEHGKGGTIDAPKALAAYQKACDAKDPAGCSRLGVLYKNGARGVMKDLGKARDLHRAACDAGDPDGCWHLGAMYELGNGVGRDAPAAESLYAKACAGSRWAACASLGNMYCNGSGSVAKDVAKGLALYEKACDAKHEDACTVLALKYKTGDGVPADRPKSLVYFSKACQAGSKSACLIAPKPPQQ